MATCNRLDLQMLGSQPLTVCPKISPITVPRPKVKYPKKERKNTTLGSNFIYLFTVAEPKQVCYMILNQKLGHDLR